MQFLPGVGPGRAAALDKLGIRTAGDLLEYFPARHDRRECRTVENLDEGMIATVVGQLTAVRSGYSRRGISVKATLTDNTGRCSLNWFNAGWMKERLVPGAIVRVTGKVSEYRQLPQFVNPRIVVLAENAQPVDEDAPAEFDAVYPATASVSSRMIGKLIADNLPRLLEQVPEWYDDAWRKKRSLIGRREAISVMHQPKAVDDSAAARRRLAYDELLVMQLATAIARRHARRGVASSLVASELIDTRIRKRFPFTLTPAQDRAIAAIVSDMAAPQPMNRLLQGDVGCGKTVVALYAALVAVANKTQVAIMAPTELLAEQHHRAILRYLENSRVRHALLTGGLATRPRRELLDAIESGGLDIVVGTQALIQHDVRFGRLGLVVVDEQHRFGVRQRATMRSKGPAPHYLVMTATPIPRTLAMTVFGDLDVTTIESMPPGRRARQTRVARPAEHGRAWEFVRSRLSAGQQAYVEYPLVEESEKIDLKSATEEFERLKSGALSDWRLGLLHGRMSTAERETVMADFGARRIDVLVSTTVIEVGIDVPNASVMVVEHAERYGLSQLHQLRGRIGRGGETGHCFLMTDSSASTVSERLDILARTDDGFKIAEQDLRLRGPGEMLGTRQHGLPELRVADLVNDAELLRMAQQDADDIIRADPGLKQPRHTPIRSALQAKYAGRAGLLDVG